MKKLYLLLFVLLSGCATSEGYNRILNTWLNSDKQNLIETWGVPTSTYKMNDHIEYLSYSRTSISSIMVMFITGNVKQHLLLKTIG